MRNKGIDREQFPSLQEDIGEDPARFLDRDLLSERNLALARIRGIDHLAVCRAWIAVERRIDRGPRQRILDELQDREEFLQHSGDRDERTPDDPRVLPDLVDPNQKSIEIDHGDAENAKIQELATDGGTGQEG